MATAIESKTVVGEDRLLLRDISWDFYKRFCDELWGRPAIRLTYSDGMLEIMITKSPHEYYKKLLAKLVEQTLFVFNIPVRSGGSMTFQRDDLEKGYEHDECWWIEHEADVRGQSAFDFHHDPPPDLAIEVEITSSAINKLSIFAMIRVPEIWRFDGAKLRFLILQENGEYEERENSRAFSFLKPEHLLPYLKMDSDVDETTRMRQFAEWLGEQQISR